MAKSEWKDRREKWICVACGLFVAGQVCTAIGALAAVWWPW